MLFVNYREALGLTGLQSIESAAERLGETVETVVVTLGAEGAIAINGGERYVAPVRDPSSPSIRPAPATCSQPPTSGPT